MVGRQSVPEYCTKPSSNPRKVCACKKRDLPFAVFISTRNRDGVDFLEVNYEHWIISGLESAKSWLDQVSQVAETSHR